MFVYVIGTVIYYNIFTLLKAYLSTSYGKVTWLPAVWGCTNTLCRLALHICSSFSPAGSAWPKLTVAWLRSHKGFVGVLTLLMKKSLPAYPAQQKALLSQATACAGSLGHGQMLSWGSGQWALAAFGWAVWWGSDPLWAREQMLPAILWERQRAASGVLLDSFCLACREQHATPLQNGHNQYK